MYPNLFGIENGSYILMMALGIISALAIFILFFKNNKYSRGEIIDLLICSLTAILLGIVNAILFQNLYNFIENPSSYIWTWSMTFIGGLIGGIIAFILMYKFFYRRYHDSCFNVIFTIAPGAITLGHFFGRIGCFLAGCCYGKESLEWYAIYFPVLDKKVIPTQLFEAIFLLLISIILIIIAFKKKKCPFNMALYLFVYGLFRFFLEFIRDDHRGFYLWIFSPSQLLCILMVISSFIIVFILKNNHSKKL